MQKNSAFLLPFLLPFFLVFLLSSCSIEKRLYRKGWYREHSEEVIAPENNFVRTNKVSGNFHSEQFPAIHKSFIDTNTVLHKRKQKNKAKQSDSADKSQNNDPPFTYREARAKLAEKGCEPDEYANKLYWLSIISLPLVFLGGIGFILGAIVYLRSKSAKDKVVAEGGNCEQENLAIVAAARRTAGGVSAVGLFVLFSIFLGVALFLFVL